MDEREDRAKALRSKLASRRDSRRRVPEELRAEAVAFAEAERASEKRYKSVAKTLGLKPDTLIWCRRGCRPNRFARVAVVTRAHAVPS